MVFEFLDALSDSVFDEEPVDTDTFLYDDKYLGKSLKGVKLSAIQKDIVERGSQIYKKETLEKLYGVQEGRRIWANTARDLLLCLGKGSGKDLVAKITCAFITYKLLCLKDPAAYFGKPPGDNIDIVNLALNADQAQRVFFTPLKKMLEKSPWFAERMVAPHVKDIEFDKSVFIYSLHSSYEAAEGLNIIAVVLDEIDGFEVEGYAQAVYKALSGTVSSRFSDTGKVIRLSFPRKKDGHMMTAYNDAVIEATKTIHQHTFKLNDELEDGKPENEFTVTWEEEEVVDYKFDNFFAIKAPTFRVNPIKSIEDYKMDFYSDETDTLMRVCANPPESDENAFFKNHEKLRKIFAYPNGWDGDLRASGVPNVNYYIHIDLSRVHDRTVVALGHVDRWVEVQVGSITTDPKPHIIIDLFRVWEPTRTNPVNHREVMEFVLELAKKFNVQKVTFDQWGSGDLIDYLVSVGIDAEKKSLARPEYQEFALAVGDERLEGPADPRLMDELTHLVILKSGKVDHPNQNHNDISEAICGVIRNCVENEKQNSDVQVVTLKSIHRAENEAELRRARETATLDVPENIRAWLESFKSI